MAGSLQNSHVVHLVPTLLLGLLASSLLALPLRALAGLRCYYAGEAGDAAAGRGAKRVKTRRAAGGKKEAAEDDIDLGGAEALVVVHLGVRTVSQLAYHGAFENLVSRPGSHSTGTARVTSRSGVGRRCLQPRALVLRRFTLCSSRCRSLPACLRWPARAWARRRSGCWAGGPPPCPPPLLPAPSSWLWSCWHRWVFVWVGGVCEKCSQLGGLYLPGRYSPCVLQLCMCGGITCLSAPVAFGMPLQVDLLSATTSPTNKALAAIWGVIGFAAALALHVLQPG